MMRRHQLVGFCLPHRRSIAFIRRREHRTFVLSLLFAALFVSELAGGQSASGESQKNAVRGVVVNSVTREPIGRALVYSPDNRFATLTDDQGRFEFALPEASAATSSAESYGTISREGVTYSGNLYANVPAVLIARKPGFLSSDRQGGVFVHAPTVLIGKDVGIALVPEARIVGRVALPSSNASDRIPVHLYRRQILEGRGHWTHATTVRARSNGEFRFADLEPGTYKLLTGELMDRDPLTFDPRGPIYGYPPVYFPNATDFQTAGAIQLTPGMTFQAELSPVRQRYYPVRVPVANGPTDDQIQVSVSVQGRKGPGFELGYSRDAQQIEGGLPNGSYIIEATKLGRFGMSGSVSLVVKDGPAESAPLTLTTNGSVYVKAKLDSKSSQETGEPVGNTGIQIWHQGQANTQNFSVWLEGADEFAPSETFASQSVSQDRDSVLFAGVPPGHYWVRVDSNRGLVAAVTAGDLDLLRRPLTLVTGANVNVEVTIRNDGAEISGSVEGAGAQYGTGAPGALGRSASGGLIVQLLGGAQVYVYFLPLPESTGQFRQAGVGQDGKFDLQQVPPGAYRVLAVDHPLVELEYHNNEALRAYDGKGQVVRLSPGQKEQLTLQLILTSE